MAKNRSITTRCQTFCQRIIQRYTQIHRVVQTLQLIWLRLKNPIYGNAPIQYRISSAIHLSFASSIQLNCLRLFNQNPRRSQVNFFHSQVILPRAELRGTFHRISADGWARNETLVLASRPDFKPGLNSEIAGLGRETQMVHQRADLRQTRRLRHDIWQNQGELECGERIKGALIRSNNQLSLLRQPYVPSARTPIGYLNLTRLGGGKPVGLKTSYSMGESGYGASTRLHFLNYESKLIKTMVNVETSLALGRKIRKMLRTGRGCQEFLPYVRRIQSTMMRLPQAHSKVASEDGTVRRSIRNNVNLDPASDQGPSPAPLARLSTIVIAPPISAETVVKREQPTPAKLNYAKVARVQSRQSEAMPEDPKSQAYPGATPSMTAGLNPEKIREMDKAGSVVPSRNEPCNASWINTIAERVCQVLERKNAIKKDRWGL